MFVASLAVLAIIFSPSAHAFWRMPCAAPLVVERLDPIVTPGKLSGHMHTVMGGSNFNQTTTTADLRASECTTCQIAQDKSAYWVPNLYFYSTATGKYTSVNQLGGMTVYYIQRYGYNGEQLYAFPDGFRMLAGNPLKRSYDGSLEAQAISYHCLDYNNPAIPETHGFPTQNCPNGVRQQIFFPSCWDGVNTDSADHKSHVAYPSQQDSGTCPSSHPYRLISLFYEIVWDTNAFKDLMSQGNFVLANGDPTGYSSHGDFFNGWDHDVLQKAVDTCLADSGVFTDCPVFNVIPSATAAQCSKTPTITEPTFGTLTALPGGNPIQWGPADASLVAYSADLPTNARYAISARANAADPRVASQFPSPISLTPKGCYADGYPLSRSMAGLGIYGVYTSTAMTALLCSQYCLGQGFAYSGTEYSSQCFCSNSMPNTQLDASKCNMACGGDASSYCGGDNALSVVYNSAGAKFLTGTSTSSSAGSMATGYTTTGNCNGASFGSGYVCWGGMQLCPIVNGIVYGACAGACFDPTKFQCNGGFLAAGSAMPTTSPSPRPSSTTRPSRTFATSPARRVFATTPANGSQATAASCAGSTAWKLLLTLFKIAKC
ncbi:hypothetical protein PYCC9005_005790 [Savitreella phatthalungensis]